MKGMDDIIAGKKMRKYKEGGRERRVRKGKGDRSENKGDKK